MWKLYSTVNEATNKLWMMNLAQQAFICCGLKMIAFIMKPYKTLLSSDI